MGYERDALGHREEGCTKGMEIGASGGNLGREGRRGPVGDRRRDTNQGGQRGHGLTRYCAAPRILEVVFKLLPILVVVVLPLLAHDLGFHSSA